MNEVDVHTVFTQNNQTPAIPALGGITETMFKTLTEMHKPTQKIHKPTPEPINAYDLVQAIEFTDAKIPGEIEIDIHGKLLKGYFNYEGILGSHIETFDKWITTTLGSQMSGTKFTIPQGTVTVINPMLYPPRISTSDSNFEMLTPQMCRDMGYTYSSELYVDLILNEGTLQEEKLGQVFIGKVPIMLGSVLCHLRGKTDRELIELGECPKDPLGYFIIKGSEKVIMIQEKLRVNRIFIFNSSSKGDIVCKMTCNTCQGSSNVTLVQGKKSKVLEVHLSFMGRSDSQVGKIGNTVSAFQIYRMLGVTDPNEMLKMVCMFTKKEYIKKIWVQLQPTFVELGQIGDDIEYIAKKKGLGDISYATKQADIMRDLKHQLFTHIPSENIHRKLQMLSIMIARFTEYLIGVRELDDRDNWGNKRLESAGRSLEQLFGNVWRELVNRTQETINVKNLQGLQSVRREIDPSFITDNFVTSFNANSWGVQGSYMTKENIVEQLKRDANAAVYSHLTKINTPTRRKAKQMKIRLIPMSQVGYVCPAETPEGQQCGLVKNSSITLYISIERDEDTVSELISPYIIQEPTNVSSSPVILNGRFIGWCNGKELKTFCIKMKRQLIIYKDTAIVLDHDGYLYIYTDAARPTRPLLVVDDDNELVIKKKDLWDADMRTLLENGCVEYIDAFEQEYIQLAQSMYHMEDRKKELEEAKENLVQAESNLKLDDNDNNRRNLEQAKLTLEELTNIPSYTHCELDPSAILGLAASLIPLSNHNQAPRNTYQCIPATTPIMTSSFTRSKIGDLKDGDTVITIDPVTLKMSETKIHSHFVIDSVTENKDMLEVITHSGRTIQATTDHAFLTLHGWVNCGDLNTNVHHIAIYPSVKCLDDTRDSNILIDIKTATDILKELNVKSHLVQKYMDELKDYGLLPLKGDYKHLPIIARMMGFMRADGHVSYTESKGLRCRMTFGREYDAELYNRDTETLGFETFKIQERYDNFYHENGDFKTTHHVWVIDRHSSFAALFIILGCVMGKKTETYSRPIPYWIMNGSDLVKREYLAGFMGGDGCKINVSTRKYKTKIGATYDMGRIVQHKNKKYLESSIFWFEQLSELFDGFGIKTLNLKVTPAYEDKVRVELEISSSQDNLIKYMDVIGYRYATTKLSESLKVVEWFKYVKTEINNGIDFREKIHDLHYIDGYTHSQLSAEYGITVTRSQYLCKSYRSKKSVDLSNNAMKLEEWLKCVTASNDCIFVPIKQIRKVKGCIVSDFTTVSDNHSFVTDSGFVTHNCGMAKQALGVYHSQHYNRYDTTAKCLSYPARPAFETQMYDIMGMGDLPAGSMVVVAICTYTGCNQEDSLIMNEASIARGLFRQEIYKSFKSVQKRTRSTVEEFCRPEVRKGQSESRFAAINEKGIPAVGSFVREGDCIIGKIRKNLTTGKIENASTYVGVSLEGVIDRVKVSLTPEGMTMVKVKIRQIRCPIMGDKFASRHAQKGTIGKILPPEEMPFTANGVIPDIVINPHSIPSRMTMAKVIEIVVSKIAACTGERYNATPYRRFNIREFKERLTEFGYNSSGKEKMFSGFTGKPLEAEIFIGPCYYQVLRHHVADKIQMRARGAINQLSHQPVGGRAIKGGQRFGEMERDGIISHGASSFLRERLSLVSDAYQQVFCSVCGDIAIANMTSDKFVCRKCEDNAKFGTAVIPYAYKYMTHILAGASFNLQCVMKEVSPTTEILN